MIEISQRTYEQMLQWTYSEYEFRMKFVVTMLVIIYAMIIYLAYRLNNSFKNKLSKDSKRKLKHICKMERRPVTEQVSLIIDMFIDAYTEKHKINWDEYLY